MTAPAHRTKRSPRRRRRALATPLLALAGLAGALTVAGGASTATAAPAVPAVGGGGAAATVGNGLTTTDLAAVGATPAGLASTLVGPGVSVSNVTYTGAPAQAGTIHLVDPAVVSFNDGVIMSSGNIADIIGPNKSDGTTGDMAGGADADLTALIAGTKTVNPTTFDAASLEFDFVPTANQVYFTYTFGSDEYLEWVNLFNDVFAFYVNGQNCATTTAGDPVSIDTINDTVNPALFRDNSFSNPPANPINIESDGLSVEMICSAPVNAGQTNHMKLAIADTSDQILDSVVMIKAHSLSTVAPESCNDGVDNDDDLKVDMEDSSCTASTTPPPAGSGSGGVGSGGSAPAFTGNEGTPIKLDASVLGWQATPDTLTTSWTVHGINGTVGDCTIDPAGPQPVGPGGAIAVVDATCPTDGEYVARVDGTDAEGSSSFDKDVDFFVHNAPPAVSIDAPVIGDQASVGDLVTVSATVVDPGVDDGVSCEISWGDGTTDPGDLSGSTCSGSHAYGTPGTKLLSVTATDVAGTSAAAASLLEVVSLQATTTDLTSTVNPTVAGQATNLVATVAAVGGGAAPTGTVEFSDGTTVVGTKALTNGKAAFTVRPLAGRTYTATYTGSATADPSTSAPYDQVVDAASTTTSLTSSANPSTTGQSVTIRAAVKAVAPGSGVPTGNVTIYEDGTPIFTKALNAGAAATTVKPTTSHTYTATYEGDASYLGSTSAPLAQVVDEAATTTTLTTSANPAVTGQYLTLTARVKAVPPGAGAPVGTVDLFQDGVLVGSRTLTNSVATWNLRLAEGHSYTATYYGGSGYGASASGALAQAVTAASTKVTVTSSSPTIAVGRTVTLRATITVASPGTGTPSGFVSFYDGSTYLGTYATSGGRASVSISTLTPGNHPITAQYLGSPAYLASSSTSAFTQVVV